MTSQPDRYIPALSFRWLTPLFDPILKHVMRDEVFKRRLIEAAHLIPGYRVLDLGCGTGTLTIQAKQLCPEIDIVGLDADPQVLNIAREKAERDGVEVHWDQGMAFDLPYRGGVYDRVLSSLMFHHLTGANKQRTFMEVFRVVRPGGEIHLVDFGQPHSSWMAFVARLGERMEHAYENVHGFLPGMMEEAGFTSVRETDRFSTVFGPVSIVSGNRAN